MTRCTHCGENASLGLAHLHGDPCRPLCLACTKREVERKQAEAEEDPGPVADFSHEFVRQPSLAA